MYQKIAAILALVLCMPAYAAQTKNTMKMVSYFPVPYVAYDTVSANNAMDIGILNKCAMDIKKGTSNLGSSACSLYLYGDENAADLNSGLLNVTAGKLDLNSNVTNARIVSKKVQIGTDMTTFGGWLDVGIPTGKNDAYDALYISSLKNTGNSFRVTSKDTGAKVNSFHMFDEISNDFPGCDGTVTWKELELGADVDNNRTFTDIYLVCDGTGEVPPQECQGPKGDTYTESCPAGQTGSITYTWVGEPTCSYTKTENCTPVATCSDSTYKASHKAECCPSAPTSDNICYTDCEGEPVYKWGSAGGNITDFLGSDWVYQSCLLGRDKEDGSSYGQCFESWDSDCWKPKELAANKGYTLVFYNDGWGGYMEEACSQVIPCDLTTENTVCIGIPKENRNILTCDWYNNEFKWDSVTNTLRCVREEGEVERCRNGW